MHICRHAAKAAWRPEASPIPLVGGTAEHITTLKNMGQQGY